MTKEDAGDQPQFSLLVMIHGSFSRFYVARGAGLDFDETKDIFVPADKIQFAPMVGRAEVAGDDDVSFSPKVEISGFFAAPAGALVCGPSLGR
jgi:hypothetical protein